MARTSTSMRRWRGRLAALGMSALVVTGLTACDAGDTGVDVEDITEEGAREGDQLDDPGITGYDGAYTELFITDDYVGDTVVLTAEIGQVVSDQAFAIGSSPDVEPLLVLSDEAVDGLAVGESVRVGGIVEEPLVLADLEARWDVDLDDAAWAAWEDATYLNATIVETGVELDEE
ncbi:hypothetical protein M4I32_05030 [Microbacterium sp. LRZ72]|uniref:hypothetical protein n=1 Tax=Microbacterium sp. LRZ72 TaxID=2942481 RepID=UPI0029BDC5C2|nr:hypothetical protein [Microbacterium sp. LRZ72]MDX2376161.1 hypothetical protein [Microbacterium sp. LRZ72]